MMDKNLLPDRFRWSKLFGLLGLTPFFLIGANVLFACGDLFLSQASSRSLLSVIVGFPTLVAVAVIGGYFHHQRQVYQKQSHHHQTVWEPVTQENGWIFETRIGWQKAMLFDISQSSLFCSVDDKPFRLQTWFAEKEETTYLFIPLSASLPDQTIVNFIDMFARDWASFFNKHNLDPYLHLHLDKRKQHLACQLNGFLGDETKIKLYLQYTHNLAAAHRYMVQAGGEFVPMLSNLDARLTRPFFKANGQMMMFRPFIQQTLKSIATDTAHRYKNRLDQVKCRQCLTQGGAHRVKINLLETATYYGCRSCGLARTLFTGSLVAVLNGKSLRERWEEPGKLRVNWSVRRELFDFDVVEIIHATDEDIERFVVQVRNNTDPVRRPTYQKLTCTVAEDCHLSPNVIHLLKQTFGVVKCDA